MKFKPLIPQIVQLAKEDNNIELLWLYGSYAKGTAHEKSDIDIAVVFNKWEKDLIKRRLRPELLAIEWQNKLDLCEGDLSILDMNNAAIPISMSVLQNGELLLSKNKSRQLQE